jgi:hypothetical protein
MEDYLQQAKDNMQKAGDCSRNEEVAGLGYAGFLAQSQTSALVAICERLDKLIAELSPANSLETGGPLWAAEDEQPATLPLRGIMPREDDDLPF